MLLSRDQVLSELRRAFSECECELHLDEDGGVLYVCALGSTDLRSDSRRVAGWLRMSGLSLGVDVRSVFEGRHRMRNRTTLKKPSIRDAKARFEDDDSAWLQRLQDGVSDAFPESSPWVCGAQPPGAPGRGRCELLAGHAGDHAAKVEQHGWLLRTEGIQRAAFGQRTQKRSLTWTGMCNAPLPENAFIRCRSHSGHEGPCKCGLLEWTKVEPTEDK